VEIVPEELQDLTWLEELLIARAHLVGWIVRLQERAKSSYFVLKGHMVLLPQDGQGRGCRVCEQRRQ
jgi:hypothetical protein